MADETVK